MRLSFAFSVASSFSRTSSWTLPPYFAFQLKYVRPLMLCLRRNLGNGDPDFSLFENRDDLRLGEPDFASCPAQALRKSISDFPAAREV
jgi:hypothetical protein